MLVPVVKVGNVGVGVHQFAVLVDVTVATGNAVGVGVIVMAVIVAVLVGVHHDVMVMLVEVVGSKRYADADGSDPHRDQLNCLDRVGEHDPRDHRTEEWGSGEDDLTAGRAELLCAAHPQRDRGPIPERADDQRTHNRPAADVPGTRDDQTEDEVHAARHDPFQERDVLRADLVDA